MRSIAGALLVFLVVLSSACGSTDVASFSAGDSEIAVATSDRFRVEFEANPGVGDDWTLVGPPDAAVARLVDRRFESDAPDDVVGAPGTISFLFEATGPGEAELVFEYCYRGCGGEGEELERTESFALVVSP